MSTNDITLKKIEEEWNFLNEMHQTLENIKTIGAKQVSYTAVNEKISNIFAQLDQMEGLETTLEEKQKEIEILEKELKKKTENLEKYQNIQKTNKI